MLKVKVKMDIRQLTQYGTAIKAGARKAVSDTAVAIRREATAAKPDFVRIDRENSETADSITSNISVRPTGTDMEAYLEFGTGLNAREILAGQSEEIQVIARGYFKTGEGTLRGQPYFYPAVRRQGLLFIKRVTEAVNLALKA